MNNDIKVCYKKHIQGYGVLITCIINPHFSHNFHDYDDICSVWHNALCLTYSVRSMLKKNPRQLSSFEFRVMKILG